MLGCIIELFGVRDKAEYDHESYLENLNSFTVSVFDALKLLPQSDTDINPFEVLFFRDFCYIFTPKTSELIELIKLFQISIIRQELLYRAALLEFNVKDTLFFDIQGKTDERFKEYKNSSITFITSTHASESILLYSKMLEIKGVGVNVNIKKVNSDYFIDNFWVSQSKESKINYNHFLDVKIPKSVINSKECFSNLLSMFKKSMIYRKISVFYIPFFYNIISQIDFKEKSKNENDMVKKDPEYVYFENYMLNHSLFENEIHIKGIELLVAAIISKLFKDEVYTYSSKKIFTILTSVDFNSTSSFYENIKRIKEENDPNQFSQKRLFINYYFIIKRRWIFPLIKRKFDDIPRAILSKSEFNRFLNFYSICKEQV